MSLKDFINEQKEIQPYKDYQNIVNELNDYRAVNPMSDEEANVLRHRGGSARMTQQYGFIPANYYGAGKEVEDYFVKNKSGIDSLGDLKNNLYGSLIGAPLKELPRKTLYDYIMQGIKGEWK